MKRSNKIKKNSFIEGAFIASIGIIICKIIGILYVIPFYSIIGDQGGALYGYAYSIYSIFLGISSAGIPLAMSKLISEYNALELYETKERVFTLGKKLLNIIGLVAFIILMIFARPLAYLIVGDTIGGNTIEDVELVIRLISTAILIVPIMSVYRGYFQGHKIIKPTSISQILEQITRVLIILIGSVIGMKIFKDLKIAVGISVIAATIGALVSFLFLFIVNKKNKKVLKTEQIKREPKVTDKRLILKLLGYAFPFIMIDIFKSLYNSVDVFMLINVLVNKLNYSKDTAESVLSVISTWGLKINQIIISISTGLMISLIPNLSSSFIKENYTDVKNKINKTYQILFVLTLPMAVGLSILSKNVWIIFYGNNGVGASVYSYYVFVSIATIFFTASITITQMLKEYKVVLISLLSGFLTKLILNIPLITTFHRMNMEGYFGSITATILGYTTAGIICLIFLYKKYRISLKPSLISFINTLITILIMASVLIILKVLINDQNITSRLLNILIVLMYTSIGGIIYLYLMIKNNVIYKVFGKDIFIKIKKKIGGAK